MEIYVRNKNTFNGEGEFIGRPSPLENPFKITSTQSREDVINQYDFYLRVLVDIDQTITSELNRLFTLLINNRKLNLICYCSPKPCHGDIIKEMLLNKYYGGTWLKEKNI